jgi:hypothetical protein
LVNNFGTFGSEIEGPFSEFSKFGSEIEGVGSEIEGVGRELSEIFFSEGVFH